MGLVHGDDFITLADDEGQDFFESCLKKRYQYKMRGRIGPRSTDSRECRVLNRYIRWPEGRDPEYEADPRHAQVILRDLGIEGGKEVTSPIVKRDLHNDGELKGKDCTTFRSLTMRGSYLGQDRYDLQHAIKELATEMKTPTNEGMVSLKRLGRYLNGKPRVVQELKGQRKPAVVEHRCLSDRMPRSIDLRVDVHSDWAGDKRTRKSTLCVVVRHGPNVIKTQVNAMKGISLSSGEAEYGAIVKGACQGLGIQSMAADWGVHVNVKVCSDSSAAIGISNRLGLGATRHLSVRHLWVQHKVKD